jgi:hypothetical protein
VSVPEIAQVLYKSFAVLTALAALTLFWRRPLESSSRTFWLLVALGLGVRVMIAWHGYGNYDGRSWEIAADAASAGTNVYLETDRYQYTPLWFYVLGFLKRVHNTLPSTVSFGTLVRLFLTLCDLATLGVLAAIGRKKKAEAVSLTLFFFLNPVSFLLTGYHGQFENLAILLLLIGVWREKERNWLWLFSTAGMLMKHNIFYEALACLRHSVKDLRRVTILFAVSCAAFFALFLPYWELARREIVRNVFLYSSYPMDYGIGTWLREDWAKWMFVAGLVVYPLALKTADLVHRLLLCALFFLVFTTGFGNQYLVLPIALGALRPSKAFFLYSTVATLFLLGDQTNLGIAYFHWMPLNAVWAAAALWWVSEQRKVRS